MTNLFRPLLKERSPEKADPTVVILIIIHKENLEPYERLSLRQCFSILGDYPIKFICPEGLNVNEYLTINPEFSFDFIPPHWQSSHQNLVRLKTMPFLYERYRSYDYILFYELDAFVFRDELMEWCRKGYDYIGAPWLEGWSEAKEKAPFYGVGNGGFSLRKTNTLLKAINSFSYIDQPIELWKRFQNAPLAGKPRKFLNMIEALTINNNTHRWLNDWMRSPQRKDIFWRIRCEDIFWGIVVNRNFKWFTVPEPQEALRFSFEVQPQYLYELNNQKLPFGCHAWWKNNLEFWRPFIREFGYEI